MLDKKFLLRLFALQLVSLFLLLGSIHYSLVSRQKNSLQKFYAIDLNGDIVVDTTASKEISKKKTAPQLYVLLRNLTKEQQIQLKQWIELLGDERYKIRENAHQKILQMGRDALPYLEKQTAHSDLQIRETIQELVTELTSE
ncbi:MAG: hypothetical protein AABZ60_22955 [Planctomycetota bacterium]